MADNKDDKFRIVKNNNPDETENLNGPAENHRRGAEEANIPEGIPGQLADPSARAPHPHSPNYGEFGRPEDAPPKSQGSTNPESFQPYYGQETPPEPDDTRHGDARFRSGGTRNWETNEPENPHVGPEE